MNKPMDKSEWHASILMNKFCKQKYQMKKATVSLQFRSMTHTARIFIQMYTIRSWFKKSKPINFKLAPFDLDSDEVENGL